MSALGAEDIDRLMLHCVTSLKNMDSMTDFVNLTHRLGIKKVNFGNLLCTKQNYAHLSLLHAQERYNENADAAMAEGNRLGIQVSLRKFFHETPQTTNPDMCAYPFTQCLCHNRRKTCAVLLFI